uniref:Uncharacterized protein n=1 Tax=Aegilops tauschii subsp. strangulata TaxID=200361 RepID=A0A452ZCK9_AEGTS
MGSLDNISLRSSHGNVDWIFDSSQRNRGCKNAPFIPRRFVMCVSYTCT